MSSQNVSTQKANSKLGNVVRVSAGNFLEMYDFMVYAYYASYIAHEIFPSSNAYASLMLTLGTFGAGYLMRPLGAVVLGAYIDRHGRRTGLLLTLFLMAIGTLVIACTPAYRTIGIIAPIVVLLGRLLQGFSAGVELGGNHPREVVVSAVQAVWPAATVVRPDLETERVRADQLTIASRSRTA